jgi:myo-inositol-1-phosphate synthase
MNETNSSVRPPRGRLGVLTPGMGAVATTLYAGVAAVRQGKAQPIGSLTQMGRLGPRTGAPQPNPLIKDVVPLAALDQIVFGGWDPMPVDAFASAVNAGVLSAADLFPLQQELQAIRPMPAVFDQQYVRNLDGENVKTGETKMDLAQQLMEDMQRFQQEQGCDRLVVVWCASTEAYTQPAPVHMTIESFERGLRNSDPAIAPSQMYAYAALSLGIPFANGAPNLTVDTPALLQLAQQKQVPICGKDFKTGQTLMKSVIAPALKARMLGVRGWYSTNILGNRDGLVLDDPDSFKSKEVSKLGVLESILEPEQYPELYADLYHKVRINYYPPAGDNKEGWDNIDIRGWLDYPMQIKIDFLCRDSILAAPIALDLALLMDLASRAGESGVQDWLSFYFKSPQPAAERPAENDLFAQEETLKRKLRGWAHC